MAKPVIKFKTYRQSQRVGGKIYGVPNLGDPVVASVTMQEVIDYAKLHNYSADTLEALLSQVIAGVGDLVARDGRPRMLSDLLKFEPVIKGTFDNLEQTVTNQKVLVRPRMLKEIKVKLDPSDYSWQNQNDTESPRLVSVAPASDDYATVTRESFLASLGIGGGTPSGWTYAGDRLCPNGWDANCSFSIRVLVPGEPDVLDLHFERKENPEMAGEFYGLFAHNAGDEATNNTVAIGTAAADAPAWYADGDGALHGVTLQDLATHLAAASEVRFFMSRTTGSGDTFTVEKKYTL